MKRLIAMLALVAGLAAAGFYGYQHFVPKPGKNDALAHIPADTVFFFGGLESRNWSEWLQALPSMPLTPTPADMAKLKADFSEAGAAGGLLFGMYSLYLELIQDPATVTERTGVRDDELVTAYAIGLVPVLRQPLADAVVFQTVLDEAELRGGVRHEASEFQGETLRRYDFGEDVAFDLLVLVRDDVAIFTLDTPVDRDAVLAMAFGLESPAQSLAETGLARVVAERYGFDPAAIGFINHKALAAGLTGADNSHLAQMLNMLNEDVGMALAPVRTAGCQRDLQMLADQWPMVAMGYTEIDAPARAMTSKVVFAADNEQQMEELIKLQGHIPTFVHGDITPLLAVALGLNVDELAPVVQSLWKKVTTTAYQCEFLVDWQQQLRQQNPALLGLATAMASGVRGVGAAVYDAQLDDNLQAGSLRAILTLSAANPAALLGRLQMLNPALAAVQIPADGSAVPLPRMFEFMPPLMLAIRGQNIVIYAGPALDNVLNSLAGESLQANALWWMRLEYARLMPFFSQVFDRASGSGGLSPEEALTAKQQLDQLGALGAVVELDLQFAPDGVVMNAKGSLETQAPEKH